MRWQRSFADLSLSGAWEGSPGSPQDGEKTKILCGGWPWPWLGLGGQDWHVLELKTLVLPETGGGWSGNGDGHPRGSPRMFRHLDWGFKS